MKKDLGTAALAFCAGLLAVLLFQQGLLGLLHAAGASTLPGWSLRPGPFHLPRLVTIALLGGGLAMVLGHLLRGLPAGPTYWGSWVVLGAVVASLAIWLGVMPLQGLPVGDGWHPAAIAVTLSVNGAWGLGTAVFLRAFGVQRAGAPEAQTGETSRFR